MRGTLYFKPKQFFVSIYPRIAVGVTEICHVALPAHALRTLQVRVKSVRNKGHFTLDAETVVFPSVPSHCSGVIEIWHMALPVHALHAVQVRLMSVSNEGYFTLAAETVFRPNLTSHCSGGTWHSLHMRYLSFQLD
jgi:hypothetical protein